MLVGASEVIEKFPRLSAMEVSDGSIADAIGGGLDYRLGGRVSWRTQADYLQTRFSSRSQNNARVSTGIVIRIGPFRIWGPEPLGVCFQLERPCATTPTLTIVLRDHKGNPPLEQPLSTRPQTVRLERGLRIIFAPDRCRFPPRLNRSLS